MFRHNYPGGAYPLGAALFPTVVQLADPLPQLLGRLIGGGEHRVAAAASLHQRRPDGRHQLGSTHAAKQTQSESAGKFILFWAGIFLSFAGLPGN